MTDGKTPTILVTGATGNVGAVVVEHLTAAGAQVRALTRSPEAATFPDGAQAVRGDLTDVDALRAGLEGADGLFLLSPVALEELNGTLIALDLAREAGTPAIAYLSVMQADVFTDPPHFAAKYAAEKMIAEYGLPGTSLRAGYYMQNDLWQQTTLQQAHIYAPPLGNAGVLAVDTRDLGEVAARSLLQRLETGNTSTDVLEVVAPQTLTANSIARIWSDLLGTEITYPGDDTAILTQVMQGAPSWMVRDMHLMFSRFQRDGLHAEADTDARLRAVLGRPMRSYVDFATEAVAAWQSSAPQDQ